MKVTAMQTCPRCGSLKTGTIEPEEGLSTKKIFQKQYKTGHLIRYVSHTKYKHYYVPNGINAFCANCGYEYRGEERQFNLNSEEMEEYRQDKGLTTGNEYFKKPNRLIKVIKDCTSILNPFS